MNLSAYCNNRCIQEYHAVFVLLLLAINGVCLFLFALAQFTTLDIIQFQAEFASIVKLVGFATGLAAAITFALAVAEKKEAISTKFKGTTLSRPCFLMKLALSALTLIAITSSCIFKSHKGVLSNLQTGIVTQFHNIEPTYVSLLMNDKELHHTDIPLGEPFELINDGISGLTVKNGKISIGCSLQIINSAGHPVIEVADLYAGKDLLDAKDAGRLQCTILTGAPMKWDEHYKVNVHFWDKFGEGNIDNTLVIRSTDKPFSGSDFSYRN